MYAVIETGGKQYKIALGDKLRVEKLTADAGAAVQLERVLLISNGEQVKIGAPLLDGGVSATVLGHGRGEKIRVFKMKRRKDYRRTQGHRQPYTEIQITAIDGVTLSKKRVIKGGVDKASDKAVSKAGKQGGKKAASKPAAGKPVDKAPMDKAATPEKSAKSAQLKKPAKSAASAKSAKSAKSATKAASKPASAVGGKKAVAKSATPAKPAKSSTVAKPKRPSESAKRSKAAIRKSSGGKHAGEIGKRGKRGKGRKGENKGFRQRWFGRSS